MKVGHFNMLFSRSLIFSLFCLPSVVFSDGTCQLMQNTDGTFRIVCEGGTIIYTEEVRTNNVYIIENCEQLKSDLISTVDNIHDSFTDNLLEFNNIINSVSSLKSNNIGYVDSSWQDNFSSDVDILVSDLRTLETSFGYVPGSCLSLKTQIQSIDCGTCSTNDNGGSCCDVDLSPILRKMNEAQILRHSTTNLLSLLHNYFVDYFGGPDSYIEYAVDYRFLSSDLRFNPVAKTYYPASEDMYSYLQSMSYTLSETQASINNYLYNISKFQLSSISNNVEHLYIESTNHFSFFRRQVSVRPVLEDWTPSYGSYYDYLTNYYIRVVEHDSFLSSTSETNWFSRIETLLASLVFADTVSSTNSVDSSYGREEKDSIIDSLSGLSDSGGSQVSLLRDTSRSLVSSLRSYSAAFSDASMPSIVHLVRVGGSDGSRSAEYIEFQSSEISPLVEACRCATTLAWCLGGLVLLFWFIHWTVKTSSSLVVFCYSVLSSIFGK